jgi:hypothetical protein
VFQSHPGQLKGSAGFKFGDRRVDKDLDENKIVDDFTILLTERYMARQLREEPHNLEITFIYCESPDVLTDLQWDVAAPATGRRVTRNRRMGHDFGIRRWLADTASTKRITVPFLSVGEILR